MPTATLSQFALGRRAVIVGPFRRVRRPIRHLKHSRHRSRGQAPAESAFSRPLLGRTIRQAGATPKCIITDRGRQFDCAAFRRWCGRRKINVRYGAVGQHGSIAVVERFIRTLKELLRLLVLIPVRQAAFRKELSLIVDWYNAHRPHSALGGRTPDEVYYKQFPACRRPRYEPRAEWPRSSPCARPWALPRGRPGASFDPEALNGRLELHVTYHEGRKSAAADQL